MVFPSLLMATSSTIVVSSLIQSSVCVPFRVLASDQKCMLLGVMYPPATILSPLVLISIEPNVPGFVHVAFGSSVRFVAFAQ